MNYIDPIRLQPSFGGGLGGSYKPFDPSKGYGAPSTSQTGYLPMAFGQPGRVYAGGSPNFNESQPGGGFIGGQPRYGINPPGFMGGQPGVNPQIGGTGLLAPKDVSAFAGLNSPSLGGGSMGDYGGGFMGGQPVGGPQPAPRYGVNPPSYSGGQPVGGTGLLAPKDVGAFAGASGGQPSGTPQLMDYNAWNSQQATPNDQSGYRDYTNNFYKDNLGNPNALPQGFLQSNWGAPYLSMLHDYQNTPDASPDSTEALSKGQSLQWLQGAPQRFSGGQTDYNAANQSLMHDKDGMYSFMSAAVPIIGGAASGGLFNVGMAGVNAAVPNDAPQAPTQALPSQGQVNQFANSGGNYAPGGGGSAERAQGGIGSVIGGGLGLAGSIDQQNQYQNYADWAKAQGQPYRDLLGSSYTNPSGYLSSPEVTGAVQQGTNALARSLSMGGNPVGNGGALQQLQNYSTNQQLDRLAQYRQQLGGFGGLNAINQSVPGAAGAAIGARGNTWNAGGALASDIFGRGGIGSGIFGPGTPGIPNLPSPPPFLGPGVDQYGNPTAGNYAGGDPSQYGDQGGNWDPNTGLPYGDPSQFDPGIDWSSLYG